MKNNSEKPTALITMSISSSELDRLKSRCNVIQAGWGFTGYRLNENELCKMVQQVEILLSGYENITAKVIQSAKYLKLIGISRSNPVNVDISEALTRKIPVLYAPARNALAAAEYTIGLMLSQARYITQSDRALRAGKFLGEPKGNLFDENPGVDITWDLNGDNPYTQFRGLELYGRTLGLIGFGNIATRVAQLATAFGMHVITSTSSKDEEHARQLGIQTVDLNKLLRESDFVSVHCAATPETKGMLDNKAFSLMKTSAYLINTARASIIDQAALIHALQNGQIAGAALDVFWYEPLPSNHPFLLMENVTLTPHLAGSTHEVPERHSRMLVDDVLAWLDGYRPTNVFNPDVFLTT